MEYVLDQSVAYYRHFEDMTRIPHGSYNEKAYSDYLVKWAGEHGLRCIQDDLNNVIIYKPASLGYEDHPAVLLQAHMDMVCAKTVDSTHDFAKDPLNLYIEDGWLKARNTTLGADDGVGCAYMLSILESNTLAHPPLECVFTVQEEAGCNGAANLMAEYFTAKRMIGLDDVGGGTSYVTTAGSIISRMTHEVTWENVQVNGYRLAISGLRSGHSGVDIEKERGSAVKIAAKTLYNLQKKGTVQLAQVDIGAADNVIPGSGFVVFTSSLSREEVFTAVQEQYVAFQQMLRWSDPDLQMELTECMVDRVICGADSREIIAFARFLPDGFRHRSMHFENLTTASSNLGVWKTEDNAAVFECCARSSMESYMEMMEEEILLMCELYHVTYTITGRVAGFDYIENSPIRKALDAAFFEVSGRHIQELFVHGGIEAGYLARLIPGMDIVTIGPLAPDEHTVNERLCLQSFDEIWQTLVKMLASL